jgi:hypothetical protein
MYFRLREGTSRMDWAWVASLDHIWRSPAFPMWLTLAAAGFFGIIVLITLLRAEKSVANGALTVITLVAVGIAVAATIREFGPADRGAPGEAQSFHAASAGLPALSCIDDLAGETVLTACEKPLFGSAESTAAALSYAASMISRLTASADATATEGGASFELQALRRAVERDRYGLMAYVLQAREHCTVWQCAAFRRLTDHNRIVANMEERVYEGLIARYAPSWNAPPPAAVAALPSSGPTGKPTNAEFPTAASTPAVSIMTPEPGTAAAPSAPRPPLPLVSAPASTPRAAVAATPALAAAKKQPAAKPAHAAASPPVQLTPASPSPAAANN